MLLNLAVLAHVLLVLMDKQLAEAHVTMQLVVNEQGDLE